MTFSGIAGRSLLVLVVSLLLTACGGLDQEIVNPTRPASVRGWQRYEAGPITIQGEFVLQKGESTHNSQFGVRVIDIYPAKTHVFDSPELPKARIQFFKMPDQALICEGVFTRGSNSLTLPDLCHDRLPWSVIYLRDISYSENWVFFDLR